MVVVKSALIYFLLVFGAGFALGIVRVTLLVPRLGVRTAELLEMPLMLAVIVLAARFIVRQCAHRCRPRETIAIGALALALLLAAEALGVLLQQQTLAAYLASRDPVSTSVFAIMLLLFAAMPWIAARRAA